MRTVLYWHTFFRYTETDFAISFLLIHPVNQANT